MPRQERTFRTKAIILKRRDFGEADRLLTLITPDRGKLDAIAKGARKATSSKTGHVELFTRADMLISRGRDLDLVVQAEMTEPYLPLREDLQRGAYASYSAELLDKFTAPGDEDLGHAFPLLDETLQRLCVEDDLRLVIRYYEIHLLGTLGFRPELQECLFPSGNPGGRSVLQLCRRWCSQPDGRPERRITHPGDHGHPQDAASHAAQPLQTGQNGADQPETSPRS